MEPGSPPSLIDALPDRYKVPSYRFRDVVDELNGRILQKDEMVGLLQWWVSMYEQTQNRNEIRAELMKVARLNVGSLTKREVTLSSISKFVDSNDWLPWLQSSDPLPLDTIPFSFTNILNQNDIPLTLGWQPMTVVDWLRHLISPDIDPAHDIRTSTTYSNRVLGILGNIWNTLSNDMKTEAKEFMTNVQWISTTKGFRKASEAYFKEADILNRLPVITANVSDHKVSIVLTEFGVKRDPDAGELCAMCVNRQDLDFFIDDNYLGLVADISGITKIYEVGRQIFRAWPDFLLREARDTTSPNRTSNTILIYLT